MDDKVFFLHGCHKDWNMRLGMVQSRVYHVEKAGLGLQG